MYHTSCTQMYKECFAFYYRITPVQNMQCISGEKCPFYFFGNSRKNIRTIITSCKWAATTICPCPSPPPWAPKCLVPPRRRQNSSSFPWPTRSHAQRCNHLTCEHGGEQSGLVTLTFNSGVRVTCVVGYLCANFGFPRSLCSRLRPDIRDRQTSDRRQTNASLNAPAY